jgi:AraC-like DNA-binding protein
MNTETEIDRLIKKYIIIFLSLLTASFIFYSLFFFWAANTHIAVMTVVCAIIQISWLPIVIHLPYSRVKKIISYFFAYILTVLFIFSVIYLQEKIITIFLWYLLIPLGAYAFGGSKFAVRATVFALAVILLVFLSVALFASFNFFRITIPAEMQLLSDIFALFISMCSIILFLQMILELHKLEKCLQADKQEAAIETEQKEQSNKEKERIELLYNRMIEWFDEAKPYCKTDFMLYDLVAYLKTNSKYTLDAIKLSGCKGFNEFVNFYRIREARKQIDADTKRRLKLETIYTQSGFRSQPTFNRVFRQHFGLTPSGYITKKNRDNNGL